MIAAWILLAGFLATAIFVSATALTGRAFGLVPRTISCGAGPAPLSIRLFGCEFRLGLIVVAGSVQFSEDHGPAVQDPPLWKQVILCLSGVIALLLAAVLLTGPEALDLAWRAAKTLVAFSLSPLAHEAVLQDALAAFAAQPAIARFAAVFSAIAGINLLPLAPFPGGAILMAIAERGIGLSRGSGIARAYLLASLAFMAWILFLLATQAWRFAQQSGLI